VSIPEAVLPFAPDPAVSFVHPEGVFIVALKGLHPTKSNMMSPAALPEGMAGETDVLPDAHAPAFLKEIAI
jgi:hypothetical protein